MAPASEVGLDYLRRRERLLARLQRVNETIAQYDGWEANEHLPPDLRREVPKPQFPRTALVEFHRMLVEELGRLEQEWPRRN